MPDDIRAICGCRRDGSGVVRWGVTIVRHPVVALLIVAPLIFIVVADRFQ